MIYAVSMMANIVGWFGTAHQNYSGIQQKGQIPLKPKTNLNMTFSNETWFDHILSWKTGSSMTQIAKS